MGTPAGIPVTPAVGRLVRRVFEREREVANSPHCIAALDALLRIHDGLQTLHDSKPEPEPEPEQLQLELEEGVGAGLGKAAASEAPGPLRLDIQA